MARVSIIPKNEENLYGLLIKKELELRRKKQGTLHRYAAKESGRTKWQHRSYPGWITFEKCLGGIIGAQIQARNPNDQWQLLSAFLGFLDRHFRKHIANISIVFDEEK